MIPIKLSIKGLYSYREMQVVDFTKLTEASIFGIFGKVGSGKSSILEAITFALYGDTERMNKSGDDRNYNMMNLRSDELLIDFECRAGKDNHLYRFTVKGRRNSKKFDDVKTFERKTYQWMPELSDWAPIEVENASEKIIGLSYENFKRTIIIPQGRFQEFIELPLSKRTQMMNEIFQLERFDLAAKVKVLKETNEKQLEHLNGKIAQLGQSTPEQLEAVKDRIQIRVIGFGWKDLHHPWSKNGADYTPEELLNHIINNIIPQQKHRRVPEAPPMSLSSRKKTKKLGTKTSDIEDLDKRFEDEKNNLINEAMKMRDNMEEQGLTDRYERMQPIRLEVGETRSL